MEEKNLIKKIEQLKEIKPNKDWVFLTKKEILQEEKSNQVVNWFFTPIRRPALAFAFRGVLVLVVVLSGAFFYLYYLNSQISEISFPEFALFENQGNKNLVASLEELQLSLKEINSSLNNLKEARNQGQALVMTEVIRGTASRGGEIVEKIKNQSPSKEVSDSLGAAFDTFKELKEVSYTIQKEMIEEALQDLESRTLSEEDQERLERAKESYKEGRETEAILWIDKIYNK